MNFKQILTFLSAGWPLQARWFHHNRQMQIACLGFGDKKRISRVSYMSLFDTLMNF